MEKTIMKMFLLPILLLFFSLGLFSQQDSTVYIELIEKENIDEKKIRELDVMVILY